MDALRQWLRRNARAGRGEIDLILRDDDTLVFVEIRTRRGGALVTSRGEPVAAQVRQGARNGRTPDLEPTGVAASLLSLRRGGRHGPRHAQSHRLVD
ncbi:MAG: YraN family protein [Guyparkeria sp.]